MCHRACVLERVHELMDRAAGDGLIQRYRHHQRWFSNTDPKDRDVAAAALSVRKLSGASNVTIMTKEREAFQSERVVSARPVSGEPGCILVAIACDSPEDVTAAFMRSCICVTISEILQRRAWNALTRLRLRVLTKSLARSWIASDSFMAGSGYSRAFTTTDGKVPPH